MGRSVRHARQLASSSVARRLLVLALVGFAFAVGRASLARAGSGATVIYLPLVFNSGSESLSQTKPRTDPSYYITTTDTNTAYNLGCSQGASDASVSPPPNSLVVLDFGGQLADGSGTLLINGGPITNGQIEAVAEEFSYGYWYCTGNDLTSVLTLAIGTNNSYFDVSASGGATWAQVVGAVVAANRSNGYASQVVAEGANDIEPAWDTTAHTEAWVNGYAANAPALYVDYGSADGCPTNSASDATCYKSNGWSQYDVWYVSWGAGPARALPEIYYSVNAGQWAMIGLYGAESRGSGGKIYFSGPLDQYPLWTTSNTSDQAWSQLWSALNGNSATAEGMPYSAEIHQETLEARFPHPLPLPPGAGEGSKGRYHPEDTSPAAGRGGKSFKEFSPEGPSPATGRRFPLEKGVRG